jgi:hypothetical protein
VRPREWWWGGQSLRRRRRRGERRSSRRQRSRRERWVGGCILEITARQFPTQVQWHQLRFQFLKGTS